ncbi:MAG: hypothetical protein CL693_09160 [Cellvibrionaceae bacterium]|nr:hypothetical protein [Cellvibrionaceae bacterium]
MNRQTELRLIKEILALKQEGKTQYHESTQTLSTERYISEQWYQKEQDALFKNRPMAIGLANEIPEIGDYQAIDWVNGISLLVVRDKNNQVRVFANACRHRNSRLVDNNSSGCKRRFSCPYHAWTYNTEGELIGAPEFESGFSDLDKKNLGLIEFNSRVISGIIYLHFDLNQQVPDNILAEEMISGFDYLNLEKQLVYKRRSYTIKANWKILLEGGIEAYHFNVAHKSTLAPFFLGNLSTWETWGRLDLRMILPKKPMLDALDLPESQWQIRKMANIIYSISPSMLFLVQPDNISLIKMIPLSKGETRIDEVLLVDASVNGGNNWTPEEEKTHETNHNLVNKILMEDWVLGESIQANMEGGAVNQVHFGRFESALIWFHQQYDNAFSESQPLRPPARKL